MNLLKTTLKIGAPIITLIIVLALALHFATNRQGKNIIVELNHLKATFDRDGVIIAPHKGPKWQWQSKHIKTSLNQESLIPFGSLSGPHRENQIVNYNYGALIERYIIKRSSIEQQFILNENIFSPGSDIVLTGAINSSGVFSNTNNKNIWKNDKGVINFFKLKVLDAKGRILHAKLDVKSDQASITLLAQEVHNATFPITIDPEIGTNDLRISDIGPDDGTNNNFLNTDPKIVYNPESNGYLVVWVGEDNTGALVDNEFEIFGQLYNTDGSEEGANFRISDMGPDGDTDYRATNPTLTVNAATGQYLVVWEGIDDSGALVPGEAEIWGQMVDSDGGLDGGNFRISDMGADGDADYDAQNPDVAFDSENNRFLVVWSGDNDTGSLVDNEFEIWGQLLNGDGSESGTDFRISDMGPDGDVAYGAQNPSVAFNASTEQFLVVFHGDDNATTTVNNEFEIWGHFVDAAGTESGSDFRISNMATDGNASFDARFGSVTYDPTNNQFFVVWTATDDAVGLDSEEEEVYGQLLNASGTEIGSDFRISIMDEDGQGNAGTTNRAVIFNTLNNQFLVVWTGDDEVGQSEVWGQYLDTDGSEFGDEFQLSDMGSDGVANFTAVNTTAAFNPSNNQFFIVWESDDDSGDLIMGETEIWGQLLTEFQCGNGFVENDEACDDGNSTNTDSCLNTCVVASCGDGVILSGTETCDNGSSNSDTTVDACRSTCLVASCGDGVVDTDEACDDGNSSEDDACSTTCTVNNVCGDSTVAGDEECDDGNSDTLDGCDASCLNETESDLEADNSSIDFTSLTVGNDIEVTSPDPRTSTQSLTHHLALATDADCDCAWTINPSSMGTYTDANACTTNLSLSSAGNGNLQVVTTCGSVTGTYNQTLIASAASSTGSGSGSAGSGGCQLNALQSSSPNNGSLNLIFGFLILALGIMLLKRKLMTTHFKVSL